MASVRKQRSIRAQCLSWLMDMRLLSVLFLLVVVTSFCLLVSERYNAISKVKTIVGDNLEPTPWHLFPKKELPSSSSYSRASAIFQCTYLSCSLPLNGMALNQNGSHYLHDSNLSCPDFFQWIHEDLAPWKRSGITKESMEAAKNHAAFRVLIVDGRLYVEPYYDCFQSRMMFTVWGLLQLLDRYPGMVPDVDIMFDCMDRPMIQRSVYKLKKKIAPALFRYCSNRDHFDIPFPDWSFWGWTEVNIAPWEEQFNEIMRGSKEVEWKLRTPTAYWKGNPDVGSTTRNKLIACNSTNDWGAEILRQNWIAEAAEGYEKSKLSKQCKNRYKIYAEGFAWSVSFKYILSCDSPVLVVTPEYYDFFTRGLIPREHYWPVRLAKLCPAIKFAVDWGNSHPNEAQAIGAAGQRFMKNLNMDVVYDYMFHLISQYSKLQKFKPRVPSTAQEVCKASVLCLANSKEKDFLKRSVTKTAQHPPCAMPKPRHDVILGWVGKNKMINKELVDMENEAAGNVNSEAKIEDRKVEEIPTSRPVRNKARNKRRMKKVTKQT